MKEEYRYFDLANNGDIWIEKIIGKYIDPFSKIDIFEIGTGVGSSALWMSKNLCLHADSMVYTAGIDAHEGIDSTAKANLENVANVSYYNGYGVKYLNKLNILFDLIYIDGDHIKLSVINDARWSLQYLKESGIIIFDDYEDNWPGVVDAVDSFVDEFNLKTEVLSNTQIMVKK